MNYKYAPEITPETWSYDKKAVSSDEQRQQSVANYPLNHPVYQNPQQSEMQNNEPPYLEFTGQKLKWNEGNKTVRSFNGMAGKIGYQNAQDQEIPDYGLSRRGNGMSLMPQDKVILETKKPGENAILEHGDTIM